MATVWSFPTMHSCISFRTHPIWIFLGLFLLMFSRIFRSVSLIALTTNPSMGTFTVPDGYADLPYTNWMSYFQDYFVGDIPVIPGSHDSGTLAVSPDEGWLGITGWLYAQTQDKSLTSQLELGVRLLDIRLYVNQDVFDSSDSIYVSHSFRSNVTLTHALSELSSFLETNPTEFVYLMLRIDSDHDLTESIPTKQSYIESVLLASSVVWSNIDSTSIKSAKVGDVAGKVILIAETDALPTTTSLKYLVYGTDSDMCDVWQLTTMYSAKQRISTCFPFSNPSTSETGIVYGYALDGQFDQIWPNINSRKINDWFMYNFQKNSAWVSRKNGAPVGVFLFDFVSMEYTSVLIDYNLQIAQNGYKAGVLRAGINAIILSVVIAIQLMI